MPKLALGAGIAQGAQAFVGSFMQARQYENQQKMMKHQIILQALYKQLEDDNIPYAKRAQLIDAIPNLLGVKMDTPLSQQMGLHDLLDDEIETQSGIDATPAKAGTPASTIENNISAGPVQGDAAKGEVSDPGTSATGTIQLQDTKDVPAGIGRDRVAEKFGDLSPARYKQLLINQQQDIDSEKALEQYRRKAEIDLSLQENTLKAQGYTQILSKGIDTNTGQYTIVRANAAGDVKLATMPKGFVPLEVMVAQTRGANSQLPASVRAYKAYFENQKNPLTGENYTEEEAQAKAVEYFKQNGDVMFGLTKAQKEAATEGTVLSNTGQKPRTQADIAADKDRDENRADRQATQLDTQYGILRDADAQLSTITSSVSSSEQTYNQAKSALDAWIQSNGEKEGQEGLLSGILGKTDRSKQVKVNVNGTNYYIDPEDLADDEYKTLNAEVDKTRSEVNRLKAEEARVRGNRESAQQRIRNLEARQAGKSGSSNTATVIVTQAQIDTFRRNNANKPKFRNMSDEKIRQLLIRNAAKWQP